MKSITLVSLVCEKKNSATWDRIFLDVTADLIEQPQLWYGDQWTTVGDLISINKTYTFSSFFEVKIKDFHWNAFSPNSSDLLGTISTNTNPSWEYPKSGESESVLTIEKPEGCRYKLHYLLEDIALDNDTQGNADTHSPAYSIPTFDHERKLPDFAHGTPQFTGDLEKDKGGDKWILSIDGGGTKGIIALHSILALETFYQKKAHEIFDMVAGSSTGALIAAGLANGKNTTDLMSLYCDLDTRRALFTKNTEAQKESFWNLRFPTSDTERTTVRNFWQSMIDGITQVKHIATVLTLMTGAIIAVTTGLAIGTLGTSLLVGAAILLVFSGFTYLINSSINDLVDRKLPETVASLVETVAPLVFVPRYKDDTKFAIFDGLFNTTKLKESSTGQKGMDIFITTKDMVRGETMYLTSFKDNQQNVIGTFKEMQISKALKSTSAAPTYFSPILSRDQLTNNHYLMAAFLDGGVGAFNNPAFVAAIEALYYSSTELASKPDAVLSNDGTYKEGHTVVWSFGTSTTVNAIDNGTFSSDPDKNVMARTDMLPFWINHLIEDGFSSASEQQTYLCKELLAKLMGKIRFRRINLFLDTKALASLGIGAIAGENQRLLTPAEIIEKVKLDAIELVEFGIVEDIAIKFAGMLWAEYFGEIYKRQKTVATTTDPILKVQLEKELEEFISNGFEFNKPFIGGDFKSYVNSCVQ